MLKYIWKLTGSEAEACETEENESVPSIDDPLSKITGAQVDLSIVICIWKEFCCFSINERITIVIIIFLFQAESFTEEQIDGKLYTYITFSLFSYFYYASRKVKLKNAFKCG